MFGLMTREKALTPGTFAYQGGLDYALGYMAGTPSFGMLISEDNERISQLLQEYEEPSKLRSAVATLTGVGAPRTIQMLNRLGHADPVDPSPRRNLEALIA